MPGSSHGLHRSLYAPGDVVTVGRTGRTRSDVRTRPSHRSHRARLEFHGACAAASAEQFSPEFDRIPVSESPAIGYFARRRRPEPRHRNQIRLRPSRQEAHRDEPEFRYPFTPTPNRACTVVPGIGPRSRPLLVPGDSASSFRGAVGMAIYGPRFRPIRPTSNSFRSGRVRKVRLAPYRAQAIRSHPECGANHTVDSGAGLWRPRSINSGRVVWCSASHSIAEVTMTTRTQDQRGIHQ